MVASAPAGSCQWAALPCPSQPWKSKNERRKQPNDLEALKNLRRALAHQWRHAEQEKTQADKDLEESIEKLAFFKNCWVKELTLDQDLEKICERNAWEKRHDQAFEKQQAAEQKIEHLKSEYEAINERGILKGRKMTEQEIYWNGVLQYAQKNKTTFKLAESALRQEGGKSSGELPVAGNRRDEVQSSTSENPEWTTPAQLKHYVPPTQHPAGNEEWKALCERWPANNRYAEPQPGQNATVNAEGEHRRVAGEFQRDRRLEQKREFQKKEIQRSGGRDRFDAAPLRTRYSSGCRLRSRSRSRSNGRQRSRQRTRSRIREASLQAQRHGPGTAERRERRGKRPSPKPRRSQEQNMARPKQHAPRSSESQGRRQKTASSEQTRRQSQERRHQKMSSRSLVKSRTPKRNAQVQSQHSTNEARPPKRPKAAPEPKPLQPPPPKESQRGSSSSASSSSSSDSPQSTGEQIKDPTQPKSLLARGKRILEEAATWRSTREGKTEALRPHVSEHKPVQAKATSACTQAKNPRSQERAAAEAKAKKETEGDNVKKGKRKRSHEPQAVSASSSSRHEQRPIDATRSTRCPILPKKPQWVTIGMTKAKLAACGTPENLGLLLPSATAVADLCCHCTPLRLEDGNVYSPDRCQILFTTQSFHMLEIPQESMPAPWCIEQLAKFVAWAKQQLMHNERVLVVYDSMPPRNTCAALYLLLKDLSTDNKHYCMQTMKAMNDKFETMLTTREIQNGQKLKKTLMDIAEDIWKTHTFRQTLAMAQSNFPEPEISRSAETW